jgi:hypothetical protein
MFFDSSHGIFIKEAAPFFGPKTKPPKTKDVPDGPKKTDGPETSDSDTDSSKTESKTDSKDKKNKKEKDPNNPGAPSGLANAAGALFGGSGNSLKDAKDPISRLLGNISDLSEKINLPTDRLAVELGQRDRLIRQLLSILNNENEVAKYFVDFRKASVPWSVTADIFQECLNATTSGINLRDAIDFSFDYYSLHRDPQATKKMIQDATAIQNNNRSIKVMRILKNAFKGDFSGMSFLMFGPKNIQDVLVMNRLVALALAKPSEDLYVLTRQILLEKDKSIITREIDDRIKAVFSTLRSGEFYRALTTEVEFVTTQFKIISGTPEYQNFRRIFVMLKLASEFRKQLFSGEEATQTAKDDERQRVTLNSFEPNIRLAQNTKSVAPLSQTVKNQISAALDKMTTQLGGAIEKLSVYLNAQQKELDLPQNAGNKVLLKDYLLAYTETNKLLSILNAKVKSSVELTNEAFNNEYYAAFKFLKQISKKYEYMIPKSESK